MNKLFGAAQEVCDFLSSKSWTYCIIGGLAVIRWGEIRFTQDADIAVLAGFGEEAQFAQSLLERFESRIANAFDFAVANRVVLIRSSNGTSIDITFATLPFENEMMESSSLFAYADGLSLPTCSADDLFIMKAFAARPKDWIDAESIALRQKGRLNMKRIIDRITELALLKEAPEIITKAKQILERKS
ncbi:MAG: hypothetical protein CVV41_01990 [Candidatus Riflebacteria bacterium HGW-Riflebacteria-1]|jgi:hypothetical protein|nr:MAG: hypothetical protein CVV41_01990 [Candidatus Riflebacteria bacterium HGW-Riflebacteria-1]